MTDFPAPLTPADCDLRGLPFMPLDVVRLGDSDLFALSTGDEFKAAVALWGKSWLQVPAASLPDDDRILAHLSSTGPGWKTVKDMALRGWVKCSDGRLYHGVIAAKAAEAWRARCAQRARANKRWHGNGEQSGAGDEAHVPPAEYDCDGADATRDTLPMPAESHGNATACPTAMQGTGRGTVEGKGELTLSKRRVRRRALDEVLPAIPSWMPAVAWNAFAEMRQRQKKPMTAHASQLLIDQLDGFRRRGINLEEALNRSTINCWSGVFEPQTKGRPGGGGRVDPAMSEDWSRLDHALGIEPVGAFS